MAPEKIILLIINVVLGGAVLGSYRLGIRADSGGTKVLWGGVPGALRPVYVVSMALAAIGYLAVLYFLFFETTAGQVSIAGGATGWTLFYPIFLLILLPSALWMPLTNRYGGDPSPGLWIAIRVVLLVVGLASIALAWALLRLEPHDRGAAYWVAVAGSIYFAFHTFVLDAILWAALFRRGT